VGGAVSGTAYVRLATKTGAGTYAGNLAFSSVGAAAKSLVIPSSEVKPKSLTITGLTAQPKVYDGTTAATVTGTAAYSGLVSGESFAVVGTPVAVFAERNAGSTKPVTVTGFIAPSANYKLTQPTGLTASITAKPLTITGLTAQPKVYDGTTAATVTGTAAYSGLVSGDSFAVVGARVAVFADRNAGSTKPVTVTGFIAPSANYKLTQPTGLTASITPKALTITGIGIANKFFDGTTSATITGLPAYAGLVTGETFSVVGKPVASFLDPNLGSGKPVTVTGYLPPSDNYTVTQPTGLKANIAIIVTVPGVVTGITATPGNIQASLTWTAPVVNGGAAISDYKIEFSSNAGSTWTTFTRSASTATTATVTGLVNGKSYLFRVSAVNSAGAGSAVATTTAITPRTVPGVVTGITATPGNIQASLAWTAPAVNGGAAISDYKIEFSSNAGSTWTTFTRSASTATTATVTGLVNGKSYLFRISAINSAGAGSAVATTTAITPRTVPGVVTGITATPRTAQASLTWTAPAVNGGAAISDYKIEFSSNAGSTWTTFTRSASTATTATVTGLVNGKSYLFRISAINSAGAGSAVATTSAARIT